ECDPVLNHAGQSPKNLVLMVRTPAPMNIDRFPKCPPLPSKDFKGRVWQHPLDRFGSSGLEPTPRDLFFVWEHGQWMARVCTPKQVITTTIAGGWPRFSFSARHWC